MVVCYFRDISEHSGASALETAIARRRIPGDARHELRNRWRHQKRRELLSRIVPEDSRIQSALGMTKRQVIS